jgi:hypothetical protein
MDELLSSCLTYEERHRVATVNHYGAHDGEAS